MMKIANVSGMNFLKQAEECGGKIGHLALVHPSPSLDFGKVTLSRFWDQNVSGTDLNRNFPCSWGAGVGSTTWLQGSSLPFWETYIGRASQILNISHFGWFIVGCKILNMTLIGCKIRVGTSFWTGDTSNNGLLWAAQNWYWGETLLALSFLDLVLTFQAGVFGNPQLWQSCDSSEPLQFSFGEKVN